MYLSEIGCDPSQITSIEPYLFSPNPDPKSDYKITNLAAPPGPPQPTVLRQWWNRLHPRRKVQTVLPLASAVVKGLFDYSDAIRQYGIFNAGRSGVAGFFQGLGIGILANVGIESVYQLYKYGQVKHWWR